MTTEPKPLDLPPMPECEDLNQWIDTDNHWKAVWRFTDRLEAHARQLAEIAQAQAALADGLAEALELFIADNGHLADGEDCTLAPLIKALAKYRENRHV